MGSAISDRGRHMRVSQRRRCTRACQEWDRPGHGSSDQGGHTRAHGTDPVPLRAPGYSYIVLGSFGTGGFHNDVSMIVDIWSNLLVEQGARFMRSFDRVVFGIHRQTNGGKIQGCV